MDRRLELHNVLCQALGSSNVYYQPPASVQIRYPAIVYSLSSFRDTHANDAKYTSRRAYQVTFITADPDSPKVETLNGIPRMRFDRAFTSDNLNHFVFTITF